MTKVDLSAIRRIHIFTDTILVSIGWLGAYGLRFALNEPLGAEIHPFATYFRALPLIVVPWMFSCWLFGIYRSTRMTTLLAEFQTLFRGAALGLLVVASISFFFRELHFGRFVVVSCVGLNFFLQGASRIAFHKLEDRMRRSGEHDMPVLIAGTGVSAIRLLQKLQDHPEIGYQVVGFVDDSDEKDRKDVANRPVLGHIDDLREIAVAQNVKEVFVAMPSLSHTRMLSIVLDCEDLGMTFRVVTNLFEVLTAGTPIDLVDDLPLVRLGRQRSHPLYDLPAGPSGSRRKDLPDPEISNHERRCRALCARAKGRIGFSDYAVWSLLEDHEPRRTPAALQRTQGRNVTRRSTARNAVHR
ncbi:MAG: hypothetical protein JRD03_09625 [Deltaproteobacteria bacterium]|nr:hypothetical protein [Deltaproteobacteria bacterium]